MIDFILGFFIAATLAYCFSGFFIQKIIIDTDGNPIESIFPEDIIDSWKRETYKLAYNKAKDEFDKEFIRLTVLVAEEVSEKLTKEFRSKIRCVVECGAVDFFTGEATEIKKTIFPESPTIVAFKINSHYKAAYSLGDLPNPKLQKL